MLYYLEIIVITSTYMRDSTIQRIENVQKFSNMSNHNI